MRLKLLGMFPNRNVRIHSAMLARRWQDRDHFWSNLYRLIAKKKRVERRYTNRE